MALPNLALVCAVLLGLLSTLARVALADPQLASVSASTNFVPTSETPPPPDLSYLQTFIEFTSADPYVYQLRWNFYTDAATGTPYISAAMSLTISSNNLVTYPWMGIGFGTSMLNAQFVVCHFNDAANSVQIHEHISRNQYASPQHYLGTYLIRTEDGYFSNSSTSGVTFICRFNRTLYGDAEHVDISSGTSLLWAFNPSNPTLNYFGEHFLSHGTVNRGRVQQLNFMNSVNGQLHVDTNTAIPILWKEIHAIGMSTAWLLIFPTAVYWARFRRSKPGWINIHAGLQIFGIVLAVTSLIMILLSYISLTQPHDILGIVLMSLLLVQIGLGSLNMLGFSSDRFAKIKKGIKIAHGVIGALSLLASFVQVYLGLDTLFPWVEAMNRGLPCWILYSMVVFIWIVAFGISELHNFFINNRAKISMLDSTNSNIQLTSPATPYSERTKTTPLPKGNRFSLTEMIRDGQEVQELLEATRAKKSVRCFTWQSLSESVISGELLVVGNGKYVYDISSWLRSHPGGQQILYSAAGTDISNDFFREAGYDAQEFLPDTHIPSTNPHNPQDANVKRPVVNQNPYKPNAVVVEAIENSNIIRLTDWELIKTTRRPHVHSRSGIQTMASLMVGELVADGSTKEAAALRRLGTFRSNTSSTSLISKAASTPMQSPSFDVFEFRRYALTEKVKLCETGDVLHYKFKFCLLYPHDSHINEPSEFLPGQSMEMRFHLAGKWISRHYTPISGNTVAFEVIVKVYGPHAVAGSYLQRQRPGDRQFQFRGPFGTPIIDPTKPLSIFPAQVAERGQGGVVEIPATYIFISGGSGITPFLQMIKSLLLPDNTPLEVAMDYTPSTPDELEAKAGQKIIVRRHYMDGWVYARNTSTRQEGVFPLTATYARCGTKTRLVLINCIKHANDLVGADLIDGALLAYRNQIDAHHFISSVHPEEVAAPPPGRTYSGRLNHADLHRILSQYVDITDPTDNSNFKVFVCGPDRLDSSVINWVTASGVSNHRISILPNVA
ncbi:uncharacterized protein BJ171DRAFT_71382 [Polychytrium aggregatum]|uniref:uncharacterized protein n=1 Tax=Polychytrium aggregatum TaxID=110093 RepID=UPI0022FED0EC|nr:uncharacterized protein BJ171DRAFT_71382 [Polychytrium aggregatum]KAI9205297.1 hypothetical protein BJ171DRAFT_71382 [Polychytrium aggregatum]